MKLIIQYDSGFVGDQFSAEFLIENKASVNMTTHLDRETPLHMVACFSPLRDMAEKISGMAAVAKCLIEHDADVNAQETTGR